MVKSAGSWAGNGLHDSCAFVIMHTEKKVIGNIFAIKDKSQPHAVNAKILRFPPAKKYSAEIIM